MARFPLPASALALAAVVGAALGYVQKLPCRLGAWYVPGGQYTRACYSDILPLYYAEKLVDGALPYVDHPVEYPVGIGAAMQAVAWLVRPLGDATTRASAFYDITVGLLAICLVVGVLAMAALAGRRRFDALWYALAPGVVLAAYINWDLAAGALTLLGLAGWARRRHVLAGVLLGLAVATKFYPVIFFWPLFLLCLRAGRLRQFAVTGGAAVGGWLVVNVPVWYVAPRGWAEFYHRSAERTPDWGSLWYFFQELRVPVLGTQDIARINLMGMVAFVAACLLIAVLALGAPRRPRLAQLCFLTLAAFLLTNKVWSPQYVLWLVPFAVLARPRLGPLVLWQLAEIGYFFAIWWYLLGVSGQPQGIGQGWYFTALLARAATVALFAALIVNDVMRPTADVVRTDGTDDPAGGVLAHARDRFSLRRRRSGSTAPAPTSVAKIA